MRLLNSEALTPFNPQPQTWQLAGVGRQMTLQQLGAPREALEWVGGLRGRQETRKEVGLCRDYRVMEKKMETTIMGLYRYGV